MGIVVSAGTEDWEEDTYYVCLCRESLQNCHMDAAIYRTIES